MRRPMRVLIVDDDERDVLLIKKALAASDWEFTVHTECTGDDALAYLRRVDPSVELPDVVLLDLNMPGRSGHEVLGELRSDPKTESLAVVIFTTSDQPCDMALAFQNRAQCFVTKPSTLAEFYQLVDQVLAFWNNLHGERSSAHAVNTPMAT